MSIAAYPPHPLLNLLSGAAGRAASFPGQELSYSELRQRALRLARALAGLGVGSGERVALLQRNSADALVALAACWSAGAVAMPLNIRWQIPELSAVLAARRPRLLLTEAAQRPGLAARARQAAPGLPVVVLPTGAGLNEAHAVADPPGSREGGPAVILHSSGTTAQPRGCVLAAERLAANAKAAAARFGFTAAERLWNPLPLYHVGGLLPWLALASRGGELLTAPRFDASTAIPLMRLRSATFAYPMFPHIFEALVEHPGFQASAVSELRAFTQVATEPQLRAAQNRLPRAAEISAYGSTEACAVSFGDPRDPKEVRLTSCGLPLDGIEVCIQEGELLVRGGGLLVGWADDLNSPLDSGGWFHTGDAAELDSEGRIRFLGRLSDALKVGGENVSPAEVEAWLCLHHAVRQAVVVGLPDPLLGEMPVAAVELRAGFPVSEEELIDHCRRGLAAFKVPRRVLVVQSWPMSATKIRRSEVRELFA